MIGWLPETLGDTFHERIDPHPQRGAGPVAGRRGFLRNAGHQGQSSISLGRLTIHLTSSSQTPMDYLVY